MSTLREWNLMTEGVDPSICWQDDLLMVAKWQMLMSVWELKLSLESDAWNLLWIMFYRKMEFHEAESANSYGTGKLCSDVVEGMKHLFLTFFRVGGSSWSNIFGPLISQITKILILWGMFYNWQAGGDCVERLQCGIFLVNLCWAVWILKMNQNQYSTKLKKINEKIPVKQALFKLAIKLQWLTVCFGSMIMERKK